MIEIPEILASRYEIIFWDDFIMLRDPDYDIHVDVNGFRFDCEDRGLGASCYLQLEDILALAHLQATLRRFMEAQK